MKQDLELFEKLLAKIVVDEVVHQDYERVTSLEEMYFSFVTGVGLDKMMERFERREDPEAFEQRKIITQHIITAVVSNITSPEQKVPRSNGMTRTLAYKDDNKFKKADELEKVLKQFWGNKSWDDWMGTRWIELNDINPNAFAIIEWKAFDPKKEVPNPYPYESKASEAVMFEYENNILQYLVDQKGTTFTMYLKNQTIQAVLLDEKDPMYGEVSHTATEKGVVVEINGELYFKKSEKDYYHIAVFKPHNLDRVPAFRAGYKRDSVTDGRTFVAPYHDAVPYLKKTIKANSELDLTMCLHAFPQKIQTANRCTNTECNQGIIYRGEGENRTTATCPQCEGFGLKIHKSAQDIILVPIPDDPEEQLSLDNMARYITPEVALMEFQQRYVEYLTDECMQAVFNSEIFTRDEIATTATEKRIDLDNIYDTLYPLSVDYSKTWRFGVEVIAELVSMHKDLIARLTFSKDFKFKSKDDYIRDRRAAKEAGAPDKILRNIDDEIIRIDTADNPHEYHIFKTVESFDPFSGKNEEEIMTALTSNTVPFKIKVLYNNIGWIFDSIFMEFPEFFQMPRKKQTDIVNAKVDEIVVELEQKNTTQKANFEEEPTE
jgi:hypothetical protein